MYLHNMVTLSNCLHVQSVLQNKLLQLQYSEHLSHVNAHVAITYLSGTIGWYIWSLNLGHLLSWSTYTFFTDAVVVVVCSVRQIVHASNYLMSPYCVNTQIYQPIVPDKYVIATCALTCDKCSEYLGICKYGIRLIIVNKNHDSIFSWVATGNIITILQLQCWNPPKITKSRTPTIMVNAHIFHRRCSCSSLFCKTDCTCKQLLNVTILCK
jgi:hypothetical protein